MATIAPATEVEHLFITGLKDAHGVEHQALGILGRQLDHLANYPEVAAMIQRHYQETEEQIQRIDSLLSGFDTSASAAKDAALGFVGNMAALAHVFAPDEILKNSFANHAFENFEAASYVSLITLADIGGYGQAKPLLQQSLDEEVRMAKWVYDNIPAVTQKFVSLRTAGETASH